MQPIRPDWNSNVGLPATPFLCKTSVRCFGSLLVAIGVAGVALARRDIRPLVYNSLLAVSALGIGATVEALLFPSKLEQSSLLRMRRKAGITIDQGNFCVLTIQRLLAEEIRLGAITNQDLELIFNCDLAKYQCAFSTLDRRNNVTARIDHASKDMVEKLKKSYLSWKFTSAQSVGEISNTPFAKKAGITEEEVVKKYLECHVNQNSSSPAQKSPLLLDVLAHSKL